MAAVVNREEPRVSGNGKNGVVMSHTVAVWAAVILALVSMFLNVANPAGNNAQLKSELREDLRKSEDVARRELTDLKHTVTLSMTKAQHDEFAERMKQITEQAREDIRQIRSDQVPRLEHQQHWAEVASQIATVRDGVIDVRKQLVEISPPADRWRTVEARIDTLQNQLNAALRMLATPPVSPARPNPL